MLMRLLPVLLLICGMSLTAQAAEAPAPDPENTLYVDLNAGRVVIRMRPDLAPKHVARIKTLVRGGFYDGALFHRVIPDFMAQTGDPAGTGAGGSGRNIPAEFTRTPQNRGTVSMARSSNKDSADSQWFIVLGDSHRGDLDNKYTAWGQVTAGMEFVDMVKKGSANLDGRVSNPDHIVRVQIAADADGPKGAKPSDAELLKRSDAVDVALNFGGNEFRCTALNSNVSAQPALAVLWTHGYLAGVYKAKNALNFGGEAGALTTAIADACSRYPQALLLPLVNQELAKNSRDLPQTMAAFAPGSYTCKDYGVARGGANKAEAEFADAWAFAYIQGLKSIVQAGLEIPYNDRARILAAVTSNCAKNADMKFADLTALVAAAVKLK